MSVSALPPFRLTDRSREYAKRAIDSAPDGWIMRLAPPTRSLAQNARLHAQLSDIAKSKKVILAGRVIDDIEDLKCLFVSAWRMETKQPSEIVPGFHGEPCQLRRSTAAMSKDELSSLMECISAWAASHGIEVGE